MSESLKVVEVEMARLSLQPGDRLVLFYPRELPPRQRAALQEAVARHFPGVPVLILENGIKLVVAPAACQHPTAEEWEERNARGHPKDAPRRLPHEFDSSGTCNYCGVAAEKTPSGTRIPSDPCPARGLLVPREGKQYLEG